jgi:hypothetical protein
MRQEDEQQAQQVARKYNVNIELARGLVAVLAARPPRCEHPSIDIESGCCAKCGDGSEETIMAQKVKSKTIAVEQGQYMPLPANNKLVAGGPAKVEVTRYDNGHLDVRIVEGQSVPVELAIIKKWTRLSWEV